MPAGPYDGQIPAREYEEDRAHEGRIQLIKNTLMGALNTIRLILLDKISLAKVTMRIQTWEIGQNMHVLA
jgi:hypothetical protein